MQPGNTSPSLPPLGKNASSPALDKLIGDPQLKSGCHGHEEKAFKPLRLSQAEIPPIEQVSLDGLGLSYDGESNISVYHLRMTCGSCLAIIQLLNSTLGNCSNLVTGLISVSRCPDALYTCKVVVEGDETMLQAFAMTLSESPQVTNIEYKAGTTGSSRFYEDFTLHLPHQDMVEACGGSDGRGYSPSPPIVSPHAPQNSPASGAGSSVRGVGGVKGRVVGPESPVGGSSRNASTSPLGNFKKLQTIQANANKFVFKVSDSFDGTSHIMKETTCMESSDKQNTMNEFKIIEEVHKRGNVPGIVSTPIMFEEDVRSSMIYKMYKMDLFNFLGIYCRKHRVGGVPESMAVVWLSQLLSSLRVLVRTNIIHRDLKLENILLDEFSNVVMTDFELAHQFSDPSNPSTGRGVEIVGTPMYIPPEVGKQEIVDPQKNDIWSLGVIAWELVCESNPWGLFVDKMHPSKIMEHTNKSRGPGKKPKNMSEQYYNFISNLICPLEQRFTVEQAIRHQIFADVDFDNIDTLFPKNMPHHQLMCNVELLGKHGLKGDVGKAASLDDSIAEQQPQDGQKRTPESRNFCRSLEKRPRITGNELSDSSGRESVSSIEMYTGKSGALRREYEKFKLWQRKQNKVMGVRNAILTQNQELKESQLKTGLKERAEFLSEVEVGKANKEEKKRGGLFAYLPMGSKAKKGTAPKGGRVIG
ncbi:hypothetical protein TrVE_jg13245 [Triparma verrucosa]|uniref:Protein kinase domain-containing protein n=1 Tax=Triparma verrucosa TaxID=1606542 RepID=A0A9W7BK60_9STRA|nr:hypothetical protein TrVE_jg13245 [Triparma verrucosa]